MAITLFIAGLFSRWDFTFCLGLCTHLTITFFSSGLFWTPRFTPVFALYDPFGVNVPLNFDITHYIATAAWLDQCKIVILFSTSMFTVEKCTTTTTTK